MREYWTPPEIQKWVHSVWDDPTSVSEWQASWEATLLSFELGTLSEESTPVAQPLSSPPGRRSKLKAHFDDYVQVAIGYEDDPSFETSWSTHSQLHSWDQKPWQLRKMQRDHVDPTSQIDRPFHAAFPAVPLVGPRAPRLLPHGAPTWMQQLSRILASEVVTTEEEPFPEIVLQTWFLREPQIRTNKQPRMIALDDQFHDWEDQLMHLWEDLADLQMEADFYVVHPDPMRTSLQSFHAHLIIVQEQRQEVPILTTVLCHGHRHDYLIQNALFVPAAPRFEELQELNNIRGNCILRQCTWWQGHFQILDDGPRHVLPGQGLHIIIHDPSQEHRTHSRFPTVQWPFDEVPPPEADPDVLWHRPTRQEMDEFSLSQHKVVLHEPQHMQHKNEWQKENRNPHLQPVADGTLSPTRPRRCQVVDATRPPSGPALSSHCSGKATTMQNQKNVLRDITNGPSDVAHHTLRLRPSLETPDMEQTFDDNLEAQPPEFRPPIWTYPAWVQELWTTLHRYGTAERADEGPVIQIVTWYIHQQRHTKCFTPRLLRLDDGCERWEAQLRQLWRDRIDELQTIEYHKVFPSPPRLPDQPIAHLILSQEPGEDKAVLISSHWETQIENLYGITHVATFLPSPVDARSVIEGSDAASQCRNREEVGHHCIAWVAQRQVTNHELIPCEDGYGIKLFIPWREPQIISSDDEDEGPSVHSENDQQSGATAFENNNLHDESTLSPTIIPEAGSQDAVQPSSEATPSPFIPPPPQRADRTHNGNDSSAEIDHDDIDDDISWMATNLARETFDPYNQPIIQQPEAARNIDSPDEALHLDDLIDYTEEELDQPMHTETEPEDATPARHPDPVRHASVIYMINSPPIHAQIPYGDRNVFYSTVANLIQIPLHQLVYLYKIPHIPEDLDLSRTIPMIAQLVGELTPGSIHRYVLADVEFHAPLPTMAPEVERSAKLLPKQLTRFQILRVFGLASYCMRAQHQRQGCLVWLNNRLIPEQDRSLIEFSHGDYLRIAVPPDEPTQEAFTTREMAAICWVGAEPIAEMGEAGREHLPDYLPLVPPDASTVYSLPPVHWEQDDHTMMQTSSALRTSSSPSAGPQDNAASLESTIAVGSTECTTEPLDDDIHSMPAFEQRLFHLQRGKQLQQTQSTEAATLVHTWYIDHQRVSTQRQSRLVALGRNFKQWRTAILTHWSDLALLSIPAMFSIVHPGPRNSIAGLEIHILVTQSPALQMTSVLLSTDFYPTAAGFSSRFALAIPRIVNTQALREVAECHDLPVGQCHQAYQGHQLMDPNRAYDSQDGDHFTIIILPQQNLPDDTMASPTVSATLPFSIEHEAAFDDSFSLLQIKAKAKPQAPQPVRHSVPPRPLKEGLGTQTESRNDIKPSVIALRTALATAASSLSLQATSTANAAKEQGQKGRPQPEKVVILLDAQLCQDRTFYPDNQFHMLFENNDWLDQLQHPWSTSFGYIPDGAPIHPQTWEALHDAPISHCEPGFIEIYVDGATWGSKAGWAAIIVLHDGAHSFLQGVLAGPVQINTQAPDWVGAASNTNISAELTALIVAETLALSFSGGACIRPDLQLSKQLIDGHTMMHNVPDMARLAIGMANLSPGHFSVTEVRAHQGHPWNELADAVAKSAARTQEYTGQVPWERVATFAKRPHEQGWAWMQHASEHLCQAFPLLQEGQVIQFDYPQIRPCCSGQPPPKHHSFGSINWTITSYNALALGADEGRGQLNARTLRLAQQLHSLGAHFVGLQETRTPQGLRCTDYYAIFSSGGAGHSNKQFLGCELWIHRTKPLFVDTDGNKYKYNDFKATVQRSTPRTLAVHMTGPCRFTIMVAHAPCVSANHSQEEVQEWWTELSCWLRKHHQDPFVMCCDANAPLASQETQYFGLVGAETMNQQGEFLEDFLQTNDITAPTTMECHQGQHGTWRHPKGHWLRRDHVFVSKPLLPTVQRTWVQCDIDTGFMHQDHLPVFCEVVMQIEKNAITSKTKWDKLKMADPISIAAFQQDLQTLPMPRWDIDVDKHNEIFNQQIKVLAKKHFEQIWTYTQAKASAFRSHAERHRPQKASASNDAPGYGDILRRAQARNASSRKNPTSSHPPRPTTLV